MKLKIFIVILLYILFKSFVVKASVTSFKRIVDKEPSFVEIVQQYFYKNTLTISSYKSLKKKIKRAAWLPTLYVGYDRKMSHSQSLSVTDNISIASGIVTVGPDDNNLDYDNDYGHTIRVRAVWELDKLIFDSNLLQLSRDKKQYVQLKYKIKKEIFQLYQKRLATLAQYLLLKKSNHLKASLVYSQYYALTELMNELTDNVFHKKFWRGK